MSNVKTSHSHFTIFQNMQVTILIFASIRDGLIFIKLLLIMMRRVKEIVERTLLSIVRRILMVLRVSRLVQQSRNLIPTVIVVSNHVNSLGLVKLVWRILHLLSRQVRIFTNNILIVVLRIFTHQTRTLNLRPISFCSKSKLLWFFHFTIFSAQS